MGKSRGPAGPFFQGAGWGWGRGRPEDQSVRNSPDGQALKPGWSKLTPQPGFLNQGNKGAGGRRPETGDRTLEASDRESGDEAGEVSLEVGLAQGGDHPFPTVGGGAEIDEKHLILSLVHRLLQPAFHAHFIDGREVALKYGILKVNAEIPADFVNPAQALFMPDVIGDDEIVAHGEEKLKPG